jgi:hypothetical protein
MVFSILFSLIAMNAAWLAAFSLSVSNSANENDNYMHAKRHLLEQQVVVNNTCTESAE